MRASCCACVLRVHKQHRGRGAGAVLNLGVGAKGQCFVGAQGQHLVGLKGADSEQSSVYPRVALFALSGYGGGDRLVTSPGGKLITDGVLQSVSHGRYPCAKNIPLVAPGLVWQRPWSVKENRSAVLRGFSGPLWWSQSCGA